MELKIDAKFEGKLTCASKNDRRNLTSFDQSTQKFKKCDFDGMLLSKLEIVYGKSYKEVMCHDNEE